MNRYFKIIFLLFSLLSSVAFSSDLSERDYDCQMAARTYGRKNNIPKFCYHKLITQDDLKTKRYDRNQESEVIGRDNILWVKNKKRGNKMVAIAGDKSLLNSIHAVALNDNDAEVALIDSDENHNIRLMIFNTQLHGNISPRSIIDGPQLQGLTSLSFDNKNERLLMLNKKEQLIYSVSSKANSLSVRPEYQPFFTSFSLTKAKAMVDIVLVNELLFVLDQSLGILIYDLQGNFIDHFQIEGANLRDLHSIGYDRLQHQLWVSDRQDLIYHFQLED